MEAIITAVKIPELAKVSIPEEGGPDAPSALFARILAGQAEKSRPEARPAAPVKGEGEKDVSRPEAGGSPSTEALGGPLSADQLPAPALSSLAPLTGNSGAVAGMAFPSPDFTRDLNFSRTVGLTSAPGLQGAGGGPLFSPPAPVAEPAPQTTEGERSSTAATVRTLNSATPAGAELVSVSASDDALPLTGPVFQAAAADPKNSSRGIPWPTGDPTAPRYGSGAGDPKNAAPSPSALAAGGPGGSGSQPESFPVPGAGPLVSLTNLPRLEVQAAEAAETMGRPPVAPEHPLPGTQPFPPEAGLLASETSTPAGPAGASPAEANPLRELNAGKPEGMPTRRAVADQSFFLTPGDPLTASAKIIPAAGPETLSAPIHPEAALARPAVPPAENVSAPIDPAVVSGDGVIPDPVTRSEFFEGESKSGSGVPDKENPAADSGKRTADFPRAAETAPAGPEATENPAVPANPGERLSPVQPAGRRPGMLEAEEGSPSGVERIAAAPVEGSPPPQASLPVESLMTAGGPPEALAVDPEPVIARAEDAVAHSAEEKNPLYRQLGRGLVLSLRRGEEKIRLTLDPPQLGTIFLELHRKGQAVEAQVWTDNETTQGLLDAQQGRLHKALEQEGFRLNRFEVAVQPDMKSFQEERWAQGRQPAWPEPQGRREENRDETPQAPAPEKNLSRFQSGHRLIDTWI